MTVNYVDIALIALILIMTFVGYFRGVLMTVINFIRYAVGFSACFFCSSNLAEPIYSSYVAPRMLEVINEKIVVDTNLDTVLTNLDQFIKGLPTFISDNIGLESLTIPKADDVAQVILDDVFTPVLLPLTKGVIFVVVFLLFFIATGLIIKLINNASKHHEQKRKEKGKGVSPLKKTDRILGAVFGIIKAAVVVLAVTSVLVYVADFAENSGSEFVNQVNNSALIGAFDKINPFNAITEGLI